MKRERLLSMWCERSAADESDAQMIISRLDLAIQRRQIDASMAFEMLKPLVAGEEFPQSVRLRAVSVMSRVINDEKTHDDAFDLLADILEHDSDMRVSAAAAHSISRVESLNDAQVIRLIRLRERYLERARNVVNKRALEIQTAAILDETVKRLQ